MEKLKFSFMKKLHIGLLPRILIAIAFGILFGNFLPGELVRLFVTFNGIFSEFLNFSIPLIIVGLVTVAIADIGKGAGKLLLITALIAYGATLFSGFLSYFTGVTIFPHLIESGAPLEEVSEAQGILPFFSVAIPPLMNVMTALVLAFTLGLGLAQLKNDTLKNAARPARTERPGRHTARLSSRGTAAPPSFHPYRCAVRAARQRSSSRSHCRTCPSVCRKPASARVLP